MPALSTRSMASRGDARPCRSSFSASSCDRGSPRLADASSSCASAAPAGACSRSMSWRFMLHLLDALRGEDLECTGSRWSCTSTSTSRSSSAPVAELARAASRASRRRRRSSAARLERSPAARAAAARGQEQVEQPLLARLALARLDASRVFSSLDQLDGELDRSRIDRLDVAADVADLGELRRLDLEERRAGEPGQPPRDLGLADAGRADHDDVLRRDLVAQLRRAAAAAASGCAARWPRRAWRRPARRCSGRARRRSRAA